MNRCDITQIQELLQDLAENTTRSAAATQMLVTLLGGIKENRKKKRRLIAKVSKTCFAMILNSDEGWSALQCGEKKGSAEKGTFCFLFVNLANQRQKEDDGWSPTIAFANISN